MWCRLVFAYQILTPAALQFFVSYADGAVESLWSIDQYFEFVLVLLLSTGLSFQVCLHCSAPAVWYVFVAQMSCMCTSTVVVQPSWHKTCSRNHASVLAQCCSFLVVIARSNVHAAQIMLPKSDECCFHLLQVPVIQVLLGNTGIVSSKQMFAQWRYVVVGATVAAAVLTPSTDPFTQTLLAVPLIGLYLGGAACVRLLEGQRASPQQS